MQTCAKAQSDTDNGHETESLGSCLNGMLREVLLGVLVCAPAGVVPSY
jgi:hypothetical protein